VALIAAGEWRQRLRSARGLMTGRWGAGTVTLVLARLRRAAHANPTRADAVLAAPFVLLALAQVLVIAPIGARIPGAIVALGSTVPVAYRRRNPVAAAVVGTAVWVIPTDGYVWVGYIAAFVLFYSLGAYADDTRAFVGATVFGLAATLIGSAVNDAAFGEYFGGISAVVAPAIAGRVVRRLRTLTAELERERERSARAAVVDERARIAREMHDVVAHSLSVIAIQADAAEAALEKDPTLAAAPLATIRASAREALTEMRRLLGVLRRDDDDEHENREPQPGLHQLGALVDRTRAAGHQVELTIHGEPRTLPAGLDLSAYRILQEALTNVHKHAPRAPATVRLDWRGDALALAVRDEGGAAIGGGGGAAIGGGGGAARNGGGGGAASAANGGHGLIGMRERARLHGGNLHAGPRPDGGYEVRAELPL
jgi:signal transduction histidine kinase